MDSLSTMGYLIGVFLQVISHGILLSKECSMDKEARILILNQGEHAHAK